MRSLPAIAKKYLSGRVVSRDYENTVNRVARDCKSLTVESYNRYLKRRLGQVASVTVQHERVVLLSLWRFAYDCHLVDEMPRGVVKIKTSKKPIRAWTVEQCCTAVKATFQLDGKTMKSGAKLGVFYRCWLLLGYETGARMSDLWRFKASDFDGQAIHWTQGKTGRPVSKFLTPACVKAVNQMLKLSPDGRILGWACGQDHSCTLLKEFLRGIGLEGTSKWLRRSGATHIEMEHPGRGKLHLGHATVGLAEKHYIDWSQVRRDIPCVPALLE